MKRTLVAVALAVVFVMALAAPALAQSLTLTTAYEMDGTINLEKQAGHLCNTGAEVKQTIVGNGVMSKTQTVAMIPGRITMDDQNDWVAGATALTVTTVWELCMPAKHVYDDEAGAAVVGLTGDDPQSGSGGSPNYLYNKGTGAFNSSYSHALTSQIWAVQVQADPGFSGSLNQVGEAAHGPFAVNSGLLDYSSTSTDWRNAGYADSWTRGANKYGFSTNLVGHDYVGSYFKMDQSARTSQGTQRRFIDLSSPWNHAYFMEDMSVVGRSNISSVVDLTNMKPGAEMPSNWWSLF